MTHASWACLLAAVVASVAGCVGMPNNGSPGTFGATPQDTTQNFDFIGALPKGPQPGWNPNEIVAGFLNASASYPTYAAIAREYLVGKGSNIWDPGWSVQVVDQVAPAPADIEAGDRRATVDVSGQVRASFNGTGQFVAAQTPQNGGSPDANQEFHLVKVNGEWRITNPGLIHGRMLNESDFASVYKPQDLYFFDPGSQVLVPDSVFVPAGTSPTSLVSNLVGALLKDPQTAWLKSGGTSTPPTITAFPSVTNLGANVYVTVEGTTVTVNLTGAAASASTPVLQNISAQLVWTLTGQQQNPPNIQAVQLELNGHPWVPRSAPCGGGLSPGSAQKQAMYDCFNPYPAGASANFYYVNNGAGLVAVRPGEPGDAGSHRPGGPGLRPDGGGPAQPVVRALGSGPVRGLATGATPEPARPVHGGGVGGRQLRGGRRGRYDPGVEAGQRPAVQFPAHVGRHRDRLGSHRLPLGRRERHHLDDRAGQHREQSPADRQ